MRIQGGNGLNEEVKGKNEKLKELGAQLRARRESLGLTVEDVQKKTKIRSKYILAMEEGNDSIAPGRAYFRVFLKSYGNFLGLDGLKFSRTYKELIESEERQRVRKGKGVSLRPKNSVGGLEANQVSSVRGVRAERRQTVRHRPKRRRRAGPVSAVFVFLLLIILGWTLYSNFWRSHDTHTPPGDTVGQTQLPNQSSGNVVGPPSVGEPGQALEKTKIAKIEPDKTTTVFQINESPLQLVLKTTSGADSRCWVRVVCDGKVEYEGTMVPDESKEFTAQKNIQVRAGKPWVLNIELNGQDLGIAGPFGPVKDLKFEYVLN